MDLVVSNISVCEFCSAFFLAACCGGSTTVEENLRLNWGVLMGLYEGL